jgi:hypothetical protein
VTNMVDVFGVFVFERVGRSEVESWLDVVVNGRRRLAVRGKSNRPPLPRFWAPELSGFMVVQHAIVGASQFVYALESI